MFMRAFGHFIGRHGYELRIDRFALFQNIYRPGESDHLDLIAGRQLFDAFFDLERHEIEVAPGAARAMAALAQSARVIILTNAPAASRPARARWLEENGLPYSLVVNSGPKGVPVATLSALTSGPTAFVDDLLTNLESVAVEAPTVHRFQMIADERLRRFAPTAPDRHRRIDDWAEMGAAIATSLNL